jgi:hypothetical protein
VEIVRVVHFKLAIPTLVSKKSKVTVIHLNQ